MRNKIPLRIGSSLLKASVSATALTAIAAAALVGQASAQTAPATTAAPAPADKGTEVVVVGVRRSLKTSQQIKKDADTVVDSITATDIGAFPDKSVAEALQRVAGITVSRFAATTDTAHFSAEPSNVLVRGLSQVRSEFNGRDTFSANSSRGLSWGDVSPELMAGVDSYKNETADMIEGGIAGTIDLRTRLPFDSKGQLIALSADASYGDLAKKWEPDASGIYSNRWDTSIGEFGVMLNAAYSKVQTQTQGTQLFRDGIFCAQTAPSTAPGVVPANAGCTTPVFPGGNGNGYQYIPTRDTVNETNYDRTRHGIAAAGQWQNHDHTLLATVQYNDTSYEDQWNEYRLMAQFYGTWQSPVSTVFNNAEPSRVSPAPGTPAFTFNDDGIFQDGTILGQYTNGTGDNIGTDNTGQVLIHQCASWSGAAGGASTNAACGGGLATPLNAITRYANDIEKTQDLSFNLKWDITDRLKTNFDVQYVHSTVTDYDMEASTQTWADVNLDMNGPNGEPKMTFASPTHVDFADGGNLANPGDYHYDYLMDHIEDSNGHEIAARYDTSYAIGDGWLSSLKVGVRYSDREQLVQWSTYNWSAMSDGVWVNSPSAPVTDSSGQIITAGSGGNDMYGQLDKNYAITSSIYPQNIYSTVNFGSNVLGTNLLSSNSFVFLNSSLVRNQNALAAALGAPALGWKDPDSPTGYEGWVPVCQRVQDLPGSCFEPSEVNHVAEKTWAAYGMLKFGGKDKTIFGGITVDGNVGLRWVQTEDISTGYTQYPLSAGVAACSSAAGAAPPSEQVGCLANAGAPNIVSAINFSNGAYAPIATDKIHINILPSFNVKFGIPDSNWIIRFAASRAMSRPDMGYLKSYVSVSSPSWDPTCNTASNCVKNSSGTTTDLVPNFTATGGNPGLKPMTADQFDLSFEDYFASVGSFTTDLFYKKFYNYIQLGQYGETFTNNGVKEQVTVQAPENDPGASVKGFEMAYQRFFDFLPGLWSGFGVQANYTHLVNTGVNNSTLNSTNAGTPIPQNSSDGLASYDSINPHSLEGLSDDSYNMIAMYEKGPWAARLAYNWRSKYLVTALDCCVGLPIWQKAQGQLDGSIRYKVTDNVEVNIEGSNLLNAQTVLQQQVSGDFTGNNPNAKRVFAPDAWFQNDRRIQFGIRLKY
jgi:TonB-dependent receptor